MAKPKGSPKTGGRQKGVENKVTQDIKEAYKQLIEDNLDNLTKWLEKIAKDDPKAAINILNSLSEYVIPKLARTELKHEGEIDVVGDPFEKIRDNAGIKTTPENE